MKKNMQKIYIALLFVFVCLRAFPQSTNVQKIAKSVFSLTTFKADGTILATGYGIFIDNHGTAISTWEPFVGAAKAVVTDANGKQLEVDYMIGANELYDVAKFAVKGTTIGAPIAQNYTRPNIPVWLIPYVSKKSDIIVAKIHQVETFMEKYPYYILEAPKPNLPTGCPVVDNQGNVIGLFQKSKVNNNLHATSALFISNLKLSGLSANDPALKQTFLRIGLPDNQQEAQIALMLSSQTTDQQTYFTNIENFIRKFPNSPDGYVTRAEYYANNRQFDLATADMQTALTLSDKKDEIHSQYSNLIYKKELYQNDVPYPAWNLDKALEEAISAYAINPKTAYKDQEAKVLYAQGKYEEALHIFNQLLLSNIRGAEVFYSAAKCRIALKHPTTEILTLLDSAVAMAPKPYTSISAPYFLTRATVYEETEEYRKAMQDYIVYEYLMQGNVNADFYYIREQCEMKGKLYQQALNDINRAVILAPEEPLYHAERASLLLRLKQFDEAILSANRSIKLAPEAGDAYAVLGMAQIQKGQKAEGLKNLAKAKELGNTQAQELMNRYK